MLSTRETSEPLSLNSIWKMMNESGNYAQALLLLEQATHLSRDDVLYAKSICLLKLKRFQEAVESLNAMSKKNVNTLAQLGLCHEELKKYDLALNYYDTLLNLPQNRDCVIAWLGKGRCYLAKEDFSHATRMYTHLRLKKLVSDTHPQYFDLLHGLALCAFGTKKFEVAAKLFFVALKAKLSEPMAVNTYFDIVYRLSISYIETEQLDNIQVELSAIEELTHKKKLLKKLAMYATAHKKKQMDIANLCFVHRQYTLAIFIYHDLLNKKSAEPIENKMGIIFSLLLSYFEHGKNVTAKIREQLREIQDINIVMKLLEGLEHHCKQTNQSTQTIELLRNLMVNELNKCEEKKEQEEDWEKLSQELAETRSNSLSPDESEASNQSSSLTSSTSAETSSSTHSENPADEYFSSESYTSIQFSRFRLFSGLNNIEMKSPKDSAKTQGMSDPMVNLTHPF